MVNLSAGESLPLAKWVHDTDSRILSREPGSNTSGNEKGDRLLIRTVASVVFGAGLGYALHRFVGCRSGACPIWASPYVSTIHGALLGFLLSR